MSDKWNEEKKEESEKFDTPEQSEQQEAEWKPKSSPKSKPWKIIGTIVAVIAIKFGYSFVATEVEVSQSKSTPWPTEFKQEFINECAVGAIEQVAIELGQEFQAVKQDPNVNKYADTLCECMTNAVENKKIVKTKYNIYRGIASLQNENEQAIMAYMGTDEGVALSQDCTNKALAHVENI